ncbi:MAG: hypothetical protein KC910_04640 [Candidatus Eremiobacteraeota bacterium]|nr:hypothetical protein [Candidatus Eremiobacteraeota bacterium]
MNVKDLKEKLNQAVASLEARSRVELVVALAGSSDGYPELSLGAALVAGAVMLFAVIFSPVLVPEGWVLVLVVLAQLAAAGLVRVDGIKRLFLRRATACSRVERAAAALFYGRGLSETRDRSAILVYVSQLERQVRFLPDTGVLAGLGRGPFNQWEHRLDGLAPGSELFECLAQLQELCEKSLPRREDDEDEIVESVLEL